MQNNMNDNEKDNKILRLEKELDRLKKNLKKQKYGLVWMDVPEAFEDDVENKLPILKENPKLAIKNKDGKPMHILIEGDNYHALTCLNYTHKGKIDVIYIDPPYNTGSDGFRYKDKRILDKFPDGTEVPKDHPYRHSYWLSFMRKRLELARELLKETGILFISIDDNEFAQLKLLCDEIFNKENKQKNKDNFIACLPTVMNLKGNNDQFGFAGTHEYTLVYSKNRDFAQIGEFKIIDEEDMDEWEEDEFGFYKKGANLKATGNNAPREKRPNLFYPIFIRKNVEVYVREDNKMTDEGKRNGDVVVLPITGGKEMSWRWSKNKINTEAHNLIIIFNGEDSSIYKKQRPKLGDLPSKKPKSIFYKPEYSSGNGTGLLKKIFGEKVFNNPKPVELIKDFIQLGCPNDGVILDFFAGTGTTGHAVMQLNDSDDGERQFILCTNDENNIMSEVCYPRIKKVIKGYAGIKGLGGSLSYYVTEFVGKNNILSVTDADKIELAHNAGELLAIAENTFELVKQDKYMQIFENDDQYTAVYFREEMDKLDDFVAEVKKLKKDVSVYIFSWEDETIFDDFEGLNNIRLKTIPQPIVEIYKQIYNLI